MLPPILSCPVPALPRPAGLKELFKSIDADSSGTITVEELRKALSHWGHKFNELELEQLMAVAGGAGLGARMHACMRSLQGAFDLRMHACTGPPPAAGLGVQSKECGGRPWPACLWPEGT